MSAHRIYEAGYQSLVSVLPPDAEIAGTSTLKDSARGKVPGVRRQDGTWVGYPWLRADVATPANLNAWQSWGANVGLRADHFPGLDIDCDDRQLAAFVQQEAFRELGPAPIRTSREPRRLLVFRAQEPFGRLAADIGYRGREHTVEALCQGRQYLVHGRHPSGSNYGWEGKPLWRWDPDDLTVVTSEDILAFFEHLESRLAGRATVTVLGSGKLAGEDAPPQESLEAPDLDALQALVAEIPNRFSDRETYIQVGCAIKAAGGDEAFGIFAEWAARWEGGDNAPETVEADWSRMYPPFRVGWSWLTELADEHGYLSAQDEFEAVEGLEIEEPEPVGIAGVMDYTDTWVVGQLAARLRDQIRYVPETGQFHIWE